MCWSLRASGSGEEVVRVAEQQLGNYLGSQEQVDHLRGIALALKQVVKKSPASSWFEVRGNGHVDEEGNVIDGTITFTVNVLR